MKIKLIITYQNKYIQFPRIRKYTAEDLYLQALSDKHGVGETVMKTKELLEARERLLSDGKKDVNDDDDNNDVDDNIDNNNDVDDDYNNCSDNDDDNDDNNNNYDNNKNNDNNNNDRNENISKFRALKEKDKYHLDLAVHYLPLHLLL